MMVVFQNKIIYMPGLPPNARWEKISDYKNQVSGVEWREETTRSGDGTRISLCVADAPMKRAGSPAPSLPVYVVFFQGKFNF